MSEKSTCEIVSCLDYSPETNTVTENSVYGVNRKNNHLNLEECKDEKTIKDIKKELEEIFGDFETDLQLNINPEVVSVEEDHEISSQKIDLKTISGAHKEDLELNDKDNEEKRSENQEVCDFDVMMEKRISARRKKQMIKYEANSDEKDKLVKAVLLEMDAAAKKDKKEIKKNRPALNKLKLLPKLLSLVNKQHLKENFINLGILKAIAMWLAPSENLPHFSIRNKLLKTLHQLPLVSKEMLTCSNIGRVVMTLHKSPFELKENKELAGKLINKWSRVLFGLEDNEENMSREEREERDMQNKPIIKKIVIKREKPVMMSFGEMITSPEIKLKKKRKLANRAVAPRPSIRDYVIRPKWKVVSDELNREKLRSRKKKSKSTHVRRIEKYLKNFEDEKKKLKMKRSTKISIDGKRIKVVT